MSSQASTTDGVTEFRMTGDASDPDIIVSEIEQTREAMSETINSISDRLDPDRLSTQAVNAATEVTEQAVQAASEVTEQAVQAATEVTVQVREAAIEVTKFAIDEAKTAVRELADQARSAVRASTVGRIEEMASYTRNTAQAAQTDLVSLVKRNPVPAALAAISLGWLWSHRSGGSYSTGYSSGSSYSGWDTTTSRYDRNFYGTDSNVYGTDSGVDVSGQARQAAGQVLNQVQERAGMIQEKAGQLQGQVGQIPQQIPMRAGQVQEQAQGFWQMLEANPIAMGAVGVVVGGIVGMMLPETEQEHRLLGETRDQVVGSMQDVAGQTMEKVQSVAKEAASAAAEEVKAQGMMPKSGSNSSAMTT